MSAQKVRKSAFLRYRYKFYGYQSRQYRALTQPLPIRQLMLMTKIADCGSLKQVAAGIRMSQSCATKALPEIKDILEQQLVNHINRGMHTPRLRNTLFVMKGPF
ncbi:LysR family transcriptional regulator [Bartonella sp. M0177]|nr:LysR family transcriptional regulator [Bartonella sp. M0177]